MSERRPGPRPAVLCTCTLGPWKVTNGNEERLRNGLDLFDGMVRAAEARGWAPDLVVWPEHFSQGESEVPRAEQAEPLDGRTLSAVAERARRCHTYAAVSLLLDEGGEFFNAVVFLDRKGELLGTYRKVFPVLDLQDRLEEGVAPGRDFPVFDLDFGRVGAQVCFDVFYEQGWQALEAAGAELVVFPSATSAVAALRSHAYRHEYYILASTFRVPTVIVDPIGGEVARTAADREVLAVRIDLDYRVLPWNSMRDFGKAQAEKYGERICQDWHREEDTCLVTSRDPELAVGEWLKVEGLETSRQHLARNRAAQDAARGGRADLSRAR